MSINKPVIKRILRLLLWLCFAVVFIMVSGAAMKEREELKCSKIEIKINHESGLYFVTENDVREIIADQKHIIGSCIDKINFSRIEKKIENNPYIQNAEIYADMKGNLILEVTQREPIVRVIHKNGVSYYIDKNANKMPLSPNFTLRIPVTTGNLKDSYNNSGAINDPMIKEVYNIADFISKDEFWSAQVEQIYVNENNEFEFIPRLGDHTILIGKNENLQEKLDKLMIFYKEGLKNTGWDNYNTINLKYDGQVIGTRKGEFPQSDITVTNIDTNNINL